MKVVILHGTKGNPNDNWFPWLKSQLERLGYGVFAPKLPTPKNQSVESWREALQNQTPFIFGQDTILVGHSCGATYMLNILNRERPEPIMAAFFVSGFLDDLGIPEYDELNYSFTHQDFDWPLIKRSVSEVAVLNGDNDPYVSTAQAEKLAKKLGVEPIFIKNGGHLNAESGYTKFPELLKMIKGVK